MESSELAKELVIRSAEISDTPLILSFIRELAAYEKLSDQVAATEEKLRKSLFGADAAAHVLIAEYGKAPAGFAVYFFNYSTWLGKNGLFLEDLYVSPEHRGTGAGKALLVHLARIAVAKDCGRFEWSVLDWNEPAIRFYDALGAKPQSEWIGYRLTGDALAALAESGPEWQH